MTVSLGHLPRLQCPVHTRSRCWTRSAVLSIRTTSVRKQHTTQVRRPQSSNVVDLHKHSWKPKPNDRPWASESSEKLPRVVNWHAGSQEVAIDLGQLKMGEKGSKMVAFPNFWLRDHCLCPKCTHPQTQQRQIDTFQIDSDVEISSLSTSALGLRVKWATKPEHESLFPWNWLWSHSPLGSVGSGKARSRGEVHRHVPPSEDISTYPSVSYDAIMAPESRGLLDYLASIQKSGFCFAPGTPPTTEATEALLNRIAFIRPTHYGGFWDFTSIANPTDTAYTNLPLPSHTDTTYFTDPCGLQLFHVISHTDGTGGASLLVDGFAAARYLHTHHPTHYETLSAQPIISHASGDAKAGLIENTARQRGYPIFMHDGPAELGEKPVSASRDLKFNPRHLTQIRWNNDDRSPLTRFADTDAMRAWYAAAKVWSEVLKMPEFEITVQLTPGNPVIFDNWRVLHGRTAFTGKRRVCGGYIGMDDFQAKLRGLMKEWGVEEDGQEDIERRTVS